MARNRIEQHPAEYREDLNPDYMAGQNEGPSRVRYRSAYAWKEIHERLHSFHDDELKQILVVAEGERLEQGAVYFDLRHPQDGEIRAISSMAAGRDNWYVPKSELSYDLWDRVTRVNIWDPFRNVVDEGEGRAAGTP